ncbi:hypothetical protein ACFS4T_00210 [Pseudomonas lini]
MITPTSALIVVPLLSGRPQARQKNNKPRRMRGLIVRKKWPDEPAEGRAVYLNEADKQPPMRPSVIRRKVPVFIDLKVNQIHHKSLWELACLRWRQHIKH